MKFCSVVLVVSVFATLAWAQPQKGKTRAKPVAPASAKGQIPLSSANVPGSSPAPACTERTGLTAVEITDLLGAHNRLRAELKLAPLAWDCALAAYAHEWASRGILEHRDTEFGESIFVSSSVKEPIASVVPKWLTERENWDNVRGTCKPGKVCTHYTQTVWKSTTKVGCGISRSATNKWKTLVVCNYDPAGNAFGPAY